MYETESLCHKCYKTIPACIYEKDGAAWMTSVCQDHGVSESMVERDHAWWTYCKTHGPKGIYNGYIVDITSRCNLNCKHCFHSTDGRDREIGAIKCELRNRRSGGNTPVILFGGEPTIHERFTDVCKELREEFGVISMVTNGTKTADDKFFCDILPHFLLENRRDTSLNISTHPESNGADIETLENARRNGVTIYSVLYLIDNLDQVEDAIDLFKQYYDVIDNMRIRAAADVWAENGKPDRIFVTDIMNELDGLGEIEIIRDAPLVTGFTNLMFNHKLHIIPASFPDVYRVDLHEIDCPPWYMAKDGSQNNLLTSMLINEGIDKGFYQGERIEDPLSCS